VKAVEIKSARRWPLGRRIRIAPMPPARVARASFVPGEGGIPIAARRNFDATVGGRDGNISERPHDADHPAARFVSLGKPWPRVPGAVLLSARLRRK
jgi:hypothetical protein